MNAEEYFCIDEAIDVGVAQKLNIFISTSEVLHVHRQIIENLEDMVNLGNIKNSLIFLF